MWGLYFVLQKVTQAYIEYRILMFVEGLNFRHVSNVKLEKELCVEIRHWEEELERFLLNKA